MRVLILTSSTGGGHNMRAYSFENWAATPRGQMLGLEMGHRKILEETHGLYQFGVGLYNWIQKIHPNLHHIYFNFLEAASMFSHKNRIRNARKFCAFIGEQKPDILLSVHGSLNHGFFELARDVMGRKNLKCVTYCGELFGGYGFSRHWVNPQADLFIGAVEETHAAAAGFGMPPERNWVGGFMLHPSFYVQPMNEEQKDRFIRTELALDPSLPILLLSTSALGANNHFHFLRALSRNRLPIQLLILCGRCDKTAEKIEVWASRHPEIPVKTLPHTTDMARIMQACIGIVARGGTGTTSEAIMSACPLLMNGLGGIMPQEKITLQFCRRRGFDLLIQKPEDLINRLREWLVRPEARLEIVERMKKARPQNHPLDILQKLAQLRTEPVS